MRLLARARAILQAQPKQKPFANQSFSELARGRLFHAVKALRRKGIEQRVPCLSLRESARAQVKELLFLNLPDRRAVRALYIVGVNLQLRLGVDARIVREE